MSYCLIVDTCLQGFVMAVAKLDGDDARSENGELGGGVSLVWSKIHPDKFGSVKFLSKSLSDAFSELNLNIFDFGKVVVGQGPGSFTGIKIGLAFVTGLYAANRNLTFLGVSSLEMALIGMESRLGRESIRVSFNLPTNTEKQILTEDLSDRRLVECCFAIKATREHGFMAYASNFDGRMMLKSRTVAIENPTENPTVKPMDELSDESSSLRSAKTYIFDQWPEYSAKVLAAGGTLEVINTKKGLEACLVGMLSLFSGPASRNMLFQRTPPEAHYLKKSTAEESLEKKV